MRVNSQSSAPIDIKGRHPEPHTRTSSQPTKAPARTPGPGITGQARGRLAVRSRLTYSLRCMHSLSRIFRVARATAHSTGGWLSYKLGWHGTARRQFERVLLLRGADFRAYVHLGRIAFDHGDYAGWRREFEHARRTDPIRFARLRHPIELFEPRLAGTQFEGSHELDSFQAADSRATWRALHPFGPDPFRGGRDGLEDGRADDGRSPDGFGRGTDLPLAPGYDPMSPEHMIPGQQLDDGDSGDGDHSAGPISAGPISAGPISAGPIAGDPLAGDPLGQEDAQREDANNLRGDQNRTP
ncbi:MAG: hypothetical protein ACI89X_005140, partial [Planctomycetota bacterium]